MPTFANSNEWYQQSLLLLQACPATTRVTFRHSISNTNPPRAKPQTSNTPSKRITRSAAAAAAAAGTSAGTADDANAAAKPPRGVLVFKTYDPVSGVVLKYRSAKAQEVSRLMFYLARLARPQAGQAVLADDEDEGVDGAGLAAQQQQGPGTPMEGVVATAPAPGGASKKKKKGKK